MAKFKVAVLGVQGLNKKVYGPGAIVTEKNFPEGVAAQLVKSGHLESMNKANDEKKLKEAEKNLKDAEKDYTSAQKAVAELEKQKEGEKDEKKKKDLDGAIEKAGKELTEAEVKLNGAKAALKELQ